MVRPPCLDRAQAAPPQVAVWVLMAVVSGSGARDVAPLAQSACRSISFPFVAPRYLGNQPGDCPIQPRMIVCKRSFFQFAGPGFKPHHVETVIPRANAFQNSEKSR